MFTIENQIFDADSACRVFILKDKETEVEYIVVKCGESVTITPRLRGDTQAG